MASLKELYKLCNSFDKAEKRYVNLYTQSFSGKAKDNYLKQLENLWSVKEYDDKLLKEKMKNISTKRLSEFNTNLFDFLCKGMLMYHSEKTTSLKLLKTAMLSEILLSKGLKTSVKSILNQTIQENENSGNDETIAHLHKLKYKLGLKTFISFEEQIEIQNNKIATAERTITESKYLKLNFEMNQLFISGLFPRTKKQAKIFEKFLNKDLIKDNSHANSNYAMHYYFMIKLPLLVMVNKYEEALLLSQKAIVFASKAFDLKKDPIPLFLQYKRYLNLQFSIEKSDKLLETIKKIRTLLDSVPSLSSKIDIWSTELDAHLNKAIIEKNYAEGIKYFEQNAKEKLDKTFKNVKRLDAKALLLARLYFLNNNIEQALEYAEMASNGEEYKFKYASISSQFLILLCHYKLGNILMLPYVTKSLYRILNNEDYLYPPEKALLSFLGKIKNPDKIQSELKKLKKVFEKEIQNPFNNTFFGNGDYLKWVDNEIK